MLSAEINIEADCTIDSDTQGDPTIQLKRRSLSAARLHPNETSQEAIRACGNRTPATRIENLLEKNIYGLGYRVWKFPEVYLALNARTFSSLPLLQEFFFVLNINKGSLSITFTLYIVHKAKRKLFSFSFFTPGFGMSFFVSYSIRRVFYFFCFPSINIVNALIYSAFRRQTQKKAGERGVNYGSCFKVNKSSCLSTWCTHAQANLFTGKNHLLPFHASQHPLPHFTLFL